MRYILFILLIIGCKTVEPTKVANKIQNTPKYLWAENTSNGYTYKYVKNDPLKTRFYTLKNGLTVVLSENQNAPRIAYNMVVRSGSNDDPSDHTGLAHYLEHMLFKGTDQMGSFDWEKEKPLLDKIEDTYELLGSTSEPDQRRVIYKKIDSLSNEAAKYAIAGEYDQLMSIIGSQKTNAYTWVDQTVYEEDLPKDQINSFLKIQGERFRNPQMRLFHTELETVYEEKNMRIDDDFNHAHEMAMDALFPTHNYGQQTTIGTTEHLKSPSIKAIKKYYQDNYVPNNMGLVLVGDFNADAVIAKIVEAFGYMVTKPLNKYVGEPQPEITAPIVLKTKNRSTPVASLYFRAPEAYNEVSDMLFLISSILQNGKNGLFDQNVMLNQELLQVFIEYTSYKDYGYFAIHGIPGSDKTVEDTRNVILGQLELLKQGQFDEKLITALVTNEKLGMQETILENAGRMQMLSDCIVKSNGKKWDKTLQWIDNISHLSKVDVVKLANAFFKDNYVVVLQEKGSKRPVPVSKPTITPVQTVSGVNSSFFKEIKKANVTTVEPKWISLANEVAKSKVGIADAYHVKNRDNQVFTLKYKFDFGTNSDTKLPFALDYLKLIGTQDKSAEAINSEFYNLACQYNIEMTRTETSITISGLQENFDQAVALFEDLLKNCVPDNDKMDRFIDTKLDERDMQKFQTESISEKLRSYALFGPDNPGNFAISTKDLIEIKAEELTSILHHLTNERHDITYYGPLDAKQFYKKIESIHQLPQQWSKTYKNRKFKMVDHTENTILFADYAAVQADVYWYRKLGAYDHTQDAMLDVFNSYFGGGMGSLVFQEIRESKGLAYSTYGVITSPQEAMRENLFMGYIGCQSDKIHESITTMNALLDQLPKADEKILSAVSSNKNTLRTSIVKRKDYIDTYLYNQDKGNPDQHRKNKYETYKAVSPATISDFQKEYLSEKPYTYTIVGSKQKLNLKSLEQYGKVKQIPLKEIFGY